MSTFRKSLWGAGFHDFALGQKQPAETPSTSNQ